MSQNRTLPTAPDADQVQIARKSVIAASFGNAMEWYDFSVYAFFASYIAGNFFADGNESDGLVATFIVFAAGFIARPAGGLVVGLIGDRRGRKAALLVSLFTMGAGTLIIAAAPPVSVIGFAAPLMLLVGRLLQGFSAGGEIGSAASYLVEQAPPDRRAVYASWLQASMGASNLLSAVIGLAITSLLSEDAVADWAWRIPFIFGLLLVPVGLYIRRSLPETEAFTAEVAEVETDNRPIRNLFATYWRTLVAGFGFSVLWTVAVYAFVIFGPTYYKIAPGLKFPADQTFLASIVGNVVLIIGCVGFGRLADRVGRMRVLLVSSLVMVVVPFLCLLLLFARTDLPTLLVVHAVLCLNVSAFVGVAPSTLPMAFPASVRASGVSVSYNVAAIGFAGFTPALLTWAVGAVSPYAPAVVVAAGALCSAACLPRLFRDVRRHSESS